VVKPEEPIVKIKGKAYTLRDAMRDPEYKEPSLVIGIFMTFFDVHVNRIPYPGQLSYKELDPIDTYFRPAPEEIAALFPGYSQGAGKVISSQTFLQEFLASGGKLATLRDILTGLLTPWRGRQRMLARVHRVLWLLRPYQVSGVVLRKPA